MKPLIDELQREFGSIFRQNQSLRYHSTLKTGGLARYFFEAGDPNDLVRIQQFALDKGLSFAVLGRGSNLIIQDEPIDFLVARLAEQGGSSAVVNGDEVTFAASTPLQKAIRFAQASGLVGMEFATGIPGTIGGAVRMNAGTRLGELSGVLKVATLIEGGERKTASNEDLKFGYRSSNIASDAVVVEATFKLEKADEFALKEATTAAQKYLQYRLDTQPIDLPNVGSVFKNPGPKTFAADLIERAGLKGRAVGGLQISPKHANFIVNAKGGTAAEAWGLVRLARDEVARQFGVDLEPEVQAFPAKPAGKNQSI